MTTTKEALEQLAQWWATLPELPLGTLGAILVVLDRLQNRYSLDLGAHTTKKGTQISGQTGSGVAKILARFGETRRFLSEGGRTSRGGPPIVGELLKTLELLHLDELSKEERNALLTEMQRWVVGRISESFDRERLRFEYRPEDSTCQAIADVLAAAHARMKEGQVAQYLVGAKLALRFPTKNVRNDSYSTSDVQSGHPGDFLLHDVVYHVTVAPNVGHYTKCKDNLQDGYRTYLLVPDRTLLATRQHLALTLGDSFAKRISTQSIESYVSQNLDELTIDTEEGVISGLRRLLELYNARVDVVEQDKSLLIEIPHNLLRRG